MMCWLPKRTGLAGLDPRGKVRHTASRPSGKRADRASHDGIRRVPRHDSPGIARHPGQQHLTIDKPQLAVAPHTLRP
jgi:hypothetical protein